MEVQLLHEVGPMFLHGFDANIKIIGYLLTLVSLGNQLQDFALPLGEGMPWRAGF